MTTQVLQLGKVERGLERWPLGLAWLLKYLFLPGKSEKARGGRLREELSCFHDGCPAGLPQQGEVLVPHFPLVQAKGRTQEPGSLVAETQNSCQVGCSRPAALSWGSVAAWVGVGAIPIRLGQAMPPEC